MNSFIQAIEYNNCLLSFEVCLNNESPLDIKGIEVFSLLMAKFLLYIKQYSRYPGVDTLNNEWRNLIKHELFTEGLLKNMNSLAFCRPFIVWLETVCSNIFKMEQLAFDHSIITKIRKLYSDDMFFLYHFPLKF